MSPTKGVTLHQNQCPQDEKDAGEDLDLYLSDPVSPETFSPIKNAFVKRVSQDYIQVAPKQESSKDVEFEGKNSVGHSKLVAEEPQVEAEVQAQAKSAPEVRSSPETEIAKGKYGMFESKNCESQPEVTGRAQTEGRVSNSLSPKRNASQVLKPEVQEMIEMEVSQAFETELMPTGETDTQPVVTDNQDQAERKLDADDSGIGLNIKDNNEAKHVESTLNVTVGAPTQSSNILDEYKNKEDDDDDDDDDDLETFTTTFQQQIQARKTFVSSVTVTSTKQAAVTLVPSNEKKKYVTEVSRQSTQNSYTQVLRSKKGISQEEKRQDERGIGSNYSKGLEVRQIEIQAKPGSTGGRNQNVTFKSISTIGQEPSQTGSENRSSNEVVATGNKIGKIDRRSPDSVDSDSESYVSALDETGSDTDTTSNYLTASTGAISSSTTSLDYVTADNDTDTETLRSPGEEVGTPVNSDDDDDEYYDSDDEYDSDAGNKTPKKNASEEYESEESTPISGHSIKTTAKYLSDLDLGYRGDAEDTTA